MGVSVIAEHCFTLSPPNPLHPGEGEFSRSTFCKLSVGHDHGCTPTMPFRSQPAKQFFPPVQPGEARLPGLLLGLFVLQGREKFS